MSRATSCPSIVHDVQSYTIVQERTFAIKIAELFEPKDGSLEFYLKTTALGWLSLDKRKGILHGIGPKVPYTKRFKITLTALNEMGHVTKSFIIVVIDTDVVETMPHTLENILSQRKKDYGYSHLALHTPELSEWLYEFYQQENYQHAFEESIHAFAKENGIELDHEKVTYHDFKSVMEHANPGFEKILQGYVKDETALSVIEINNRQLRNLIREGSQQTGTIAIPVWNHLASTNTYKHSNVNPISNVLDASTELAYKFQQRRAKFSHAKDFQAR